MIECTRDVNFHQILTKQSRTAQESMICISIEECDKHRSQFSKGKKKKTNISFRFF